MTRPNIPAALSFDSRGINDASSEYSPRLFSITPGRTNDPQTQALGHALAAVPALLEALETIHANAAESPEWIRRHTVSALISAGYQF